MGPPHMCRQHEVGGCEPSVVHWITPWGRTRCRVLLAASGPFPP